MVPSGVSRSDPKNGLLLPDLREPSLKQFWLVRRCSSYQKKSIAQRNKKSRVRLNADIRNLSCSLRGGTEREGMENDKT